MLWSQATASIKCMITQYNLNCYISSGEKVTENALKQEQHVMGRELDLNSYCHFEATFSF